MNHENLEKEVKGFYLKENSQHKAIDSLPLLGWFMALRNYEYKKVPEVATLQQRRYVAQEPYFAAYHVVTSIVIVGAFF